MGTVMESYEFLKNTTITNETFISNNSGTGNAREDSIRIIQSSVASVRIIANLTVIVVFLNHRKLRRKIPNIFIINQVRKINTFAGGRLLSINCEHYQWCAYIDPVISEGGDLTSLSQQWALLQLIWFISETMYNKSSTVATGWKRLIQSHSSEKVLLRIKWKFELTVAF